MSEINKPITFKKGLLVGLGILSAGFICSKLSPDKKAEARPSPAPSVVAETSSATPAPTPQADLDQVPVIAVAKLLKAYEDNSILAEKMMYKKEMVVVGKVGSIGRDITGAAYATISAGELGQAQMMFEKQDADALLGVSKGQVVAIRGVLGRPILGSIIGRKCSLVKASRE